MMISNQEQQNKKENGQTTKQREEYGKNVVHIVDPNTKEEVSYFLEPGIKKTFDEKIKPDLEIKDKDCFIAFDGKEGCQPKGSKVLMSDGSWKNIEEIKVGDEVISPKENGEVEFAKVLNTTKWFSKENYDVIELNRKKRTLYSCSSNHLIPINKVKTHRFYKKEKRWREWIIQNYEAKELLKKGKNFKKNITTITCPLIKNFKNRENCKIEPYTLGVWLGDGHFSSKSIKKKNNGFDKDSLIKGHWRNLKSGKTIWQKEYSAKKKKKEYLTLLRRNIGITSNDFEILEEVSKYYQISNIRKKKGTNAKTYDFSLNGELSILLSKYGLEGKGSGEKFIPKEALLSDFEYRKKLLAGLIDTDGTLSKENSYSITTKSKKLAQDIYSLVRSLGGRAEINKIKKGIKKTGFIGNYFNISFYLGKLNLPIKLEKKIKKTSTFYLSSNRISIDLKKSKPQIVYGFELSGESKLYVTDNWVVTHNSGKSTIAMQWCKYIDPTFNLSRVVFTPEEFREAIFKAKKGQAVMFDEAFTGFSSRAALSGVNKTLISLMMQIRQKNLFVAIVLPTIFLLDKYISIFRTRALVHVYENKGRRGFFRVYSSKKKKQLILHKDSRVYSYGVRTNSKGRFYGVFALGEKYEAAYRKKKEKALEHSEHNPMSSGAVKYREQRDIMLYVLKKELKLSYKKIEELLGEYDFDVSYVQIRNICSKFGDKDQEEDSLKKDD